MIRSQGRQALFSPTDIKKTVESTTAALTKPQEVEIIIYSFCSKKASKNIQLCFKGEDRDLSFEEIVNLGIKPENVKVTIDGEENPLGTDSGTGTYYPSGSTTGVEHKFDKDPIFVCRNDEYSSGGKGAFANQHPGAGFMKIHCKNDFKNGEFTVSIENVEKANFKPATKSATFNS